MELPVNWALCVLLTFLAVEAQVYLNAVTPLTFFIGLATVSLAIPLWHQRTLICDNALAMLVATLIATLSGMGAAWLTGTVLGLSATELASIAPRMTTLAVALPLSTSTGGLESLTILGVMCNGIDGVLIAEPLWRLFGRKTHPEDRAFTLGTTSHAMGIAWSINIAPDTVAFASCGMLLSALMTTTLYRHSFQPLTRPAGFFTVPLKPIAGPHRVIRVCRQKMVCRGLLPYRQSR